MYFFFSLIPATLVAVLGYFVLFSSTKAHGGVKTFGQILGSARWWGLVGLLPLVTGLTGSCPAYVPFGIDTHRVRHEAPGEPNPST